MLTSRQEGSGRHPRGGACTASGTPQLVRYLRSKTSRCEQLGGSTQSNSKLWRMSARSSRDSTSTRSLLIAWMQASAGQRSEQVTCCLLSAGVTRRLEGVAKRMAPQDLPIRDCQVTAMLTACCLFLGMGGPDPYDDLQPCQACAQDPVRLQVCMN